MSEETIFTKRVSSSTGILAIILTIVAVNLIVNISINTKMDQYQQALVSITSSGTLQTQDDGGGGDDDDSTSLTKTKSSASILMAIM